MKTPRQSSRLQDEPACTLCYGEYGSAFLCLSCRADRLLLNRLHGRAQFASIWSPAASAFRPGAEDPSHSHQTDGRICSYSPSSLALLPKVPQIDVFLMSSCSLLPASLLKGAQEICLLTESKQEALKQHKLSASVSLRSSFHLHWRAALSSTR